MPKLLPHEIHAALSSLPHWRYQAAGDHCSEHIQRDWVFADFVQAFSFMSQLALVAEKLQHHPDWRNSYNHVSISLSTHDAHGLTLRDIEMAHQAEQIAARCLAPTPPPSLTPQPPA
jgi:4a-hydroxytetrahydrobiopterin dehydratase